MGTEGVNISLPECVEMCRSLTPYWGGVATARQNLPQIIVVAMKYYKSFVEKHPECYILHHLFVLYN